MDLAWNALAVPGALALVVAWAMAAFVLAAAPARSVNRLLAVLLFFEGLVQVRAGPLYLFTDARDAFALEAVHVVGVLALPLLYLLFLATLDTPVVRPLRSRAARVVLLAAGAAGLAAWFLAPRAFVTELKRVPHAPWEPWSGPALNAVYLVGGLVALFGLVATLSEYRRAAPGSTARARARAYALAFGARDAVYGLLLVAYPFLILAERLDDVALVYVVAAPLASLAFVLLMAYGILRAQLFDIDVRIKWTLSRGSVAAVFVAVFFVVSESAQTLLQNRWGTFAGIAATAVLVFAMTPLQRAADRLADAAMPNTRPVRELSHVERVDLYREQVRVAWSDGSLSLKERRMLDVARERLRLGAEEAERLEKEAVAVASAR